MIDDLSDGMTRMNAEYDIKAKQLADQFAKERRAATNAALEFCPQNIRDWLVRCTSYPDGNEAHSSNVHGYDNVEWFEVGHNASHYFSFGVRSDGVFIKKTNGDEYHEECQCWYNKTTLNIITSEEIPKNYWGHMQGLELNFKMSIIDDVSA